MYNLKFLGGLRGAGWPVKVCEHGPKNLFSNHALQANNVANFLVFLLVPFLYKVLGIRFFVLKEDDGCTVWHSEEWGRWYDGWIYKICNTTLTTILTNCITLTRLKTKVRRVKIKNLIPDTTITNILANSMSLIIRG